MRPLPVRTGRAPGEDCQSMNSFQVACCCGVKDCHEAGRASPVVGKRRPQHEAPQLVVVSVDPPGVLIHPKKGAGSACSHITGTH